MAKNREGRIVNVTVVGLSGTEREKGAAGVGKSCLCNRFVRPRADDFYETHTSLISQSDFGGRVVNNDQFLYWGEVRRVDESGSFTFRIVEQTEFVDDATFQPHRSTNPQPYVKRAATAKLCSAEKLMYICTDQLGVEQDFEQLQMPDGKLTVDGFILCCDVSLVANRPLADQLDFVGSLCRQLAKTKRPFVVAATKCDIMVEQFLRELHSYLARAKVSAPVVETSAHENVNVDSAFLVLAQLVERTRGGRPRPPCFSEAARLRREAVEAATERYARLLARLVSDFRADWWAERGKVAACKDYQEFVYLRGERQARDLFRRHLRKLRDDFVCRRKLDYLAGLLRALEILLPDLSALEGRSWSEVRENLPALGPPFEARFVVLPPMDCWAESVHVENAADGRIPFDFLRLPDAELVYQEHLKRLKVARWKAEMKEHFRHTLENNNQVMPGKTWEEVQVFLSDEEACQHLTESERLEVYGRHQQEICKKAREAFQELLLEQAELFAELELAGVLNRSRVTALVQELRDEPRFVTLQRLEAERQALLLRHIGFMYHPTAHTCPAAPTPGCVDALVQQLLDHRIMEGSGGSENEPSACLLRLATLGLNGLGHELANEATSVAAAAGGGFALDGHVYELSVSVIECNGDEDYDDEDGEGKIDSTKLADAYLGAYDSTDALRRIEETLSRFEHMPGLVPAVGLVLAADSGMTSKQLASLRLQGAQVAGRRRWAFVDASVASGGDGCSPSAPARSRWKRRRFRAGQVAAVLSELLDGLQRPLTTSLLLPPPSTEADLCVTMCVSCGDPFPPELVLTPLLESHSCTVSPSGGLALEVFLGIRRRRVEVIAMSYHAAGVARREDPPHGYILVYAARRRASLAALRAFLGGLPDVVPVLLLAVTSGDGDFFTDVLVKELLTEGEAIAADCSARFLTAARFSKQAEMFTAFFRDAYSRRAHTEDAMVLWGWEGMGRTDGGDDNPLPPPPPPPPPLDLDDGEPPPPYSPIAPSFEDFPCDGHNDESTVSGSLFFERGYRLLFPQMSRPLQPSCGRLESELLQRLDALRFDSSADYAEPLDAVASTCPVASTLSTGRLLTHQSSEDAVYSVPQDSKQGRVIRVRGRPIPSAGDFESPLAPPRKPVPYRMRSEKLRLRRMQPLLPATQLPPPPEPSAGPSGSEGSDDEPQLIFPSLRRKDDRKKKKSLLRKSKYRKQESKKEIGYFGLPLAEVARSSDNPVPFFIEKCVHYIDGYGLTTEGLYRVSGNKTEQEALQKQFESDHFMSFEALDLNVNTVAGCLKAFLTELPEPLLPCDVHADLVEAYEIPDKTGRLLALRGKLKKLPTINQEVLRFIITHLHKVSQYSSENFMTAENLSICFWPTLMRPDFSSVDALTATRSHKYVVETFIAQCPFIFYNQDEVVEAGGGGSVPGSPAPPYPSPMPPLAGQISSATPPVMEFQTSGEGFPGLVLEAIHQWGWHPSLER
uniref:Rho GTPase activating protein 5 n=1 Tax=Eptatretus burgeri TaxID=7764 RepID=A0A8C4R9U1_EPTBU